MSSATLKFLRKLPWPTMVILKFVWFPWEPDKFEDDNGFGEKAIIQEINWKGIWSHSRWLQPPEWIKKIGWMRSAGLRFLWRRPAEILSFHDRKAGFRHRNNLVFCHNYK